MLAADLELKGVGIYIYGYGVYSIYSTVISIQYILFKFLGSKFYKNKGGDGGP